jgi:hypothetical protein
MNIDFITLFAILSFGTVFLFGFFFGLMFASKFNLYLKVSKKEDYEAKVKALDVMIDEWNNKVNEVEEPTKDKVRQVELFPADLNRDFGLPREL